MIQTPDEARAELKRLGLPDIFERITHRDIPMALVGTCEPVKRYYQLLPELAKKLPACQAYVPLWETNLEAVVAYDSDHHTFVRYYYGSDSDELIGTTYQQFLSAVLLELVDSGVWDELDELARLFRYKYVEKLRSFIDSCDDSNFEASNRNFVSSIPD
jgi:hypothetical protein